MFCIKHLSGILMVKNQEMLSFQLDGHRIDFDVITPVEELEWKPFDFWNGYNRLAVQEFLNDRLPLVGRQDLEQSCVDAGIPLDADAILHFSCGRAIDDECWIKFPDGPQTWQEYQKDRLEKSDRILEKQRKRIGIG